MQIFNMTYNMHCRVNAYWGVNYLILNSFYQNGQLCYVTFFGIYSIAAYIIAQITFCIRVYQIETKSHTSLRFYLN